MPVNQKYEQAFTFRDIDNVTVLALCYQVMENLHLNFFSAGTDTLIGATPKNRNNEGQQVVCRIEGSELFISSEMIDPKVADMRGTNKKNVQAFVLAFGEAKTFTDIETIERNKEAIHFLAENTIRTPEQQRLEKAEINQPMKLPAGNLYITYMVVAANVLVFLLMTFDGAGLVDPNPLVHIRWGSDFTPLTLSGDWWRLLSSMFIHFGIVHLAMNMYCLYTLGVYLEPLWGKARYLTAYVCTGVIANVVSLWWHTGGTNSAGASGAVFGIYGVFLAMLTSSLIPKEVRQPLLQNIVIFVVYI